MINNNCTLCEGRGFTTYFREGYEFAKKCDCIPDLTSIVKDILKDTIKRCETKESKSFFKKILSDMNSVNSFENASLSDLSNMKSFSRSYLKTGIYGIDKLSNNGTLPTGNLHLITGEAFSGKSSLIEHIALANAKNKRGVASFSLKANAGTSLARLHAKTSGVQLNKILNNTLNDNELSKVVNTAEINSISYANFYIIEPKTNHIGTILSDIYTLSVKDGIDIFFIDHLQQLLMPKGNYARNILEYNAISFLLTTIIKKLNITIFAVSQSNTLAKSNIKDTSLSIYSIPSPLAQNAASIISTSIRSIKNNSFDKKIMKIKVEKSRYIKSGTTVEVLFDQETTKILNIFE